MKKIITLVLALTASLAMTVTSFAGWVQSPQGLWCYTDDRTGSYVYDTWVQDSTGNYAFIDYDGFMVSNSWILDDDGKWYFAGSNGYAIKGSHYIPAANTYYDVNYGYYVSSYIDANTYSFDQAGVNY